MELLEVVGKGGPYAMAVVMYLGLRVLWTELKTERASKDALYERVLKVLQGISGHPSQGGDA